MNIKALTAALATAALLAACVSVLGLAPAAGAVVLVVPQAPSPAR